MLSTCSTPRSVGRWLWWSITPLVGMAGVAGSYLALGTGNAVFLAAATALLATSTGWALPSDTPRPRHLPGRLFIGTVTGAMALAVIGLLLQLGSVALAIIAADAGTGWFVLRCPPEEDEVRGSSQARAEAAGPVRSPSEQLPRDPLPSLPSLPALGTPELCRTWQLTYPRLQRATSPAEIEHLTELRRGCLAQLERRAPAAFGRWVTTARAASDPAPYFCRPVRRVTRDVAP